MDLNRPPFLSLNFFWRQYDAAQRGLFILLMAASIVAGAFFLFAYEAPTFWSLQMEEATVYTPTDVEVQTITENYRSYPLEMPVWEGLTNYVTLPLLPHKVPVLLFTLLQLLFWVGFLTALSYVQSNWIFGGLLLFAIHTHLSQATTMLIDGPVGYAFELGVLLLLLGIPYAFTAGWIKAGLWPRFILILLMLGGLWGTVIGLHGWQAAHAMAANAYVSQVFWAGFIIFFFALGPMNAILAGATNRRQKAARLSYPVILGLMIVWLFSAAFLLNEYLQLPFLLKGLGGIKPTYILIPMAIAAPFLAQNHFHFARKAISSQFVYTILILCASIFMLSHGALQSALGDFSAVNGFDRFVAGAIFFVGLGQLCYILVNHKELLQHRINLYFVIPYGPRVRFFFVWAIAFAGWLIVESLGIWSGARLLRHSQQVRLADQEVMEGNITDAVTRYRYACDQVQNSTKAHFNQGTLLLAPSSTAESYDDRAREALTTLAKLPRFPYAGMAIANLWSITGRNTRARNTLRDQFKVMPNAYVAANLSASYFYDTLPDSVIVWAKRAITLDPNLSPVFSNLGLLYDIQGESDVAKSFFEASLETPEVGTASNVNALAWQLKHRLALSGLTTPDSTSRPELQYNYLLNQMVQGNIDQDLSDKAAALADREPNESNYLLDSWLRFSQGKYDEAVSRLAFVKSQLSSQDQGKTSLMLALAYLNAGVPEMARTHFTDAYYAGIPWAGLAKAHMDLDLGRPDSAQIDLSLLRVTNESLWNPASKELALLLLAQNEPIYAGTEYDLSRLTAHDWVKAGQYADSIKQFIPALENFRNAIKLDSGSAAPYLEMARIYNRYNDSAAIENARYGLSLFPNNNHLRVSLAKAYFNKNNLQQASTLLDSIKGLIAEADIVRGEVLLAKGDTAGARSVWESLHAEKPLYQPAILKLAALYRAQNDLEAGHTLISEALDLNTENAEIWYYYAAFFKAWSQSVDAGNGALRAIDLSTSNKRRQAIQEEFAAEIQEALK